MDLLHTEIQTEFRDLVTVPNLYMVTQPLQVVRASGSIITAEVSLGYDVHHGRVAEILCNAAARAGLKDAFVQVRELGDFSITYRVAGLLEDIQSLISARSALRVAMLDTLHEAGIEIVSPNFMNTRALDTGKKILPRGSTRRSRRRQKQAEDVAFDKATEAASVEKIRGAIAQVNADLDALTGEGTEPNPAAVSALEEKKALLAEQLKAAEEAMKAKELAEKQSGLESN